MSDENTSQQREAAKLLVKSVKDIDIFKSGLHTYKGFNFTFVQPKEMFEALQEFEVREDDLFIITYPKSGTHWIFEIVNLILKHGDESKIDRTKMTTALDLLLCQSPDMVNSVEPGYKQMERWESPRIIPSHIMEQMSPPQLWTKRPKVIYFARNAKDLALSYFHFSKHSLPSELQMLESFIPYFLSKEFLMGNWFNHVKQYWKHRDEENFLFLKYEDCHKDLRGSVVTVAEFLGKSLTEADIQKIVEHSTMKGMRKSYDKIEETFKDSGKAMTRAFGQLSYIRKGQVGGWKSEFTVAQNELFDKVYAEEMADTDLEFTFELAQESVQMY